MRSSYPTARIKSRSPGSKQRLRVQQTDKGVFLDLEEHDGSRKFIISVTPKSARALAKWILKNIEEEVIGDDTC